MSALTIDMFDRACRQLGPLPDSRKIIISPMFTRQYRYPRSKKKRIRLKWTKRKSNFKPFAFFTRDAIYIHPMLTKDL